MRCLLFSAAVIVGVGFAELGARHGDPAGYLGIEQPKCSRPRSSRTSAGVASTGATAILYPTPTILPRMATMRLRPRTPTIHPRMTPMRLRLPSRMVTIHPRMATTATIRPRMASMVSIRPRMATE